MKNFYSIFFMALLMKVFIIFIYITFMFLMLFLVLLFLKDSPLSRTILGPEENIMSLKKDDIISYIQKVYI
jgi:hypothetical protein